METAINFHTIAPKIKLICKGCKRELNHRVPRPALIKFLMPWLQFKKYKCTHCMRTTYRNS